MTPEASDHLAKARDYLSKARSLLDVMHYSDEAARAAYLAGFHAAQALVFERTTRIAKTHSGLRAAFARLAKKIRALSGRLRAFSREPTSPKKLPITASARRL